mmetsp:Transcript_25447/g.58632  ORF Transcript_25447/g.58632 Transcript_25447/m.58632 type:complete len:207 (+) Transcript_25447:395-1015(+)
MFASRPVSDLSSLSSPSSSKLAGSDNRSALLRRPTTCTALLGGLRPLVLLDAGFLPCWHSNLTSCCAPSCSVADDKRASLRSPTTWSESALEVCSPSACGSSSVSCCGSDRASICSSASAGVAEEIASLRRLTTWSALGLALTPRGPAAGRNGPFETPLLHACVPLEDTRRRAGCASAVSWLLLSLSMSGAAAFLARAELARLARI